MAIKDFFENISRKRSFKRQIQLKQKEGEMESKAFRMEQEAELATSVGKKKKRIREARRKIFEESPAFIAIESFKKTRRGIKKASKSLRNLDVSGFGVAREDMFFGSSKPTRRSRKKSRKTSRSTEDDTFGDLGTDSFF